MIPSWGMYHMCRTLQLHKSSKVSNLEVLNSVNTGMSWNQQKQNNHFAKSMWTSCRLHPHGCWLYSLFAVSFGFPICVWKKKEKHVVIWLRAQVQSDLQNRTPWCLLVSYGFACVSAKASLHKQELNSSLNRSSTKVRVLLKPRILMTRPDYKHGMEVVRSLQCRAANMHICSFSNWDQ